MCRCETLRNVFKKYLVKADKKCTVFRNLADSLHLKKYTMEGNNFNYREMAQDARGEQRTAAA